MSKSAMQKRAEYVNPIVLLVTCILLDVMLGVYLVWDLADYLQLRLGSERVSASIVDRPHQTRKIPFISELTIQYEYLGKLYKANKMCLDFIGTALGESGMEVSVSRANPKVIEFAGSAVIRYLFWAIYLLVFLFPSFLIIKNFPKYKQQHEDALATYKALKERTKGGIPFQSIVEREETRDY